MMIAIAEKPRQDPRKQANDRFLEMLPKIRRRAQFAFRSAPSEQRAELVQEAVANAYVAFARLVERGKEGTAFATPLANYAIRRVLAVRLAGSGLSAGDVLSCALRLGSGIVVESLDTFDDEQGACALRWWKIAAPGQQRLRLREPIWPPGFNRCRKETAGLLRPWPPANRPVRWRGSLI